MRNAALPLAVLAILLTGSLALPALGPGLDEASPDPEAPVEQRLVDAGLATADRVRAAAGVLGSAPLSAALAQVAGTSGLPAPEPASGSLAEALDRLAVAAGLPAGADQPDGFDALTPEQQAHVAQLVDGVRESSRILDLAFAGLPADDRAFLRANLLRLDQAGSATQEDQEAVARLERLAAQVDPALLRAAGIALLQATEGIPSAPQSASGAAAASASAAAAAAAPWPQFCGSFGSSLVDATGMVEVGLAGPNGYLTERVLLVDLEGNECYENHPASVGPGSNLLLPVSAIVDLGGNDRYFTGNAFPTFFAPGTTWASGVGIGGVGLLVDRWGDDHHYANLNDEPLNCGSYGGGNHWQRVYAQGVGILGFGGLVDASGNDVYDASSVHTFDTPGCHWNRVYTFAQGVGARIGLGVLADDTGDDVYRANAYAQGKFDNNAHVQAQAAAAARGLGLLVDKEGQDRYQADTQAYTGNIAFTNKGNFASTFAQASLYGTNEPRMERLGVQTSDVVAQGLAVSCHTTAGSPQGGTSVGTPCDLQAVALLVDILGIDGYSAQSHAWDRDMGCDWAAWAMTSAQGSAPAKGVAALADASADEGNAFDLQSTADSRDCPTLGVRSASYGQGFGGAILWDHWDAPPFDPLLVTDLSIGLLLRGGLCDGPQVAIRVRPPTVNPTIPPTVTPAAIDLALDTQDLCKSPWASDTYRADAHANNDGGGIAWSRTHAQGSGNGREQDPFGTVYDALGIGVNADAFGDDAFDGTARSDSPFAALDPLVGVQGTGLGAVGVLVNVGDVDWYFADSVANGASAMGPIFAQADGQVMSVTFTVCVPVGNPPVFCSANTLNLAVGVLVDAFGSDTYSQPCAFNGPPLVLMPAIWGNVLGTCVHNNGALSSGIILGVDATT